LPHNPEEKSIERKRYGGRGVAPEKEPIHQKRTETPALTTTKRGQEHLGEASR